MLSCLTLLATFLWLYLSECSWNSIRWENAFVCIRTRLCVCVCVRVAIYAFNKWKATSVLGGARHGLCGKRTHNDPDCGGHTHCTRVGRGSRGNPCGWWTWRSPGKSPCSGRKDTRPRALLRPRRQPALPAEPPAATGGWAGCEGEGEGGHSGGLALPAGAPSCTWWAGTSGCCQRGMSPCWGEAEQRGGGPEDGCPSCGRWWGPWDWHCCGLGGWSRACVRMLAQCPAPWGRADGGHRALGSLAEAPCCHFAGPAPC